MTINEVSEIKGKIIRKASALHNKMIYINILCAVCLIFIVMSVFITPFWISPVLLITDIIIFIAVQIIFILSLRYFQKKVRNIKFLYRSEISAHQLYKNLQPILIKKYNIHSEIRNNSDIYLSYKRHIFHIIMQQDNTFSIWWHKYTEYGKTLSKYKTYKIILYVTGITAYEIQKNLCLNE